MSRTEELIQELEMQSGDWRELAAVYDALPPDAHVRALAVIAMARLEDRIALLNRKLEGHGPPPMVLGAAA